MERYFFIFILDVVSLLSDMVQFYISNLFCNVIVGSWFVLCRRNHWRIHCCHRKVKFLQNVETLTIGGAPADKFIFRIIWWMIVTTSFIFVGLFIVEGFPFKLIAVGLFSNVVYLGKHRSSNDSYRSKYDDYYFCVFRLITWLSNDWFIFSEFYFVANHVNN